MYQGAILATAASEAGIPAQWADGRAGQHEAARNHGDAHLRSTKEVTGYGIVASDGRLGHVDDFIVDDKAWKIRYLAVNTHDWWPGKKVLLPPGWIGRVNWPDHVVTVEATRDQFRNAPEWNPGDPIDSTFEDKLSKYYDRQRHVAPEIPAERATASAQRS
jgi:hypothetical protein